MDILGSICCSFHIPHQKNQQGVGLCERALSLLKEQQQVVGCFLP